mmetsp:Transcript_81703/g.249567  ORF Transcript_81703/g.249567 Transcript_81703/m.249567 type:complete len:309 (+) Transcript_81703:236-1162(+)
MRGVRRPVRGHRLLVSMLRLRSVTSWWATDVLVGATPFLLLLCPSRIPRRARLAIEQSDVRPAEAVDPTSSAAPILLGLRPLARPINLVVALVRGHVPLRRAQGAPPHLRLAALGHFQDTPPRRPVFAIEGLLEVTPFLVRFAAPRFRLREARARRGLHLAVEATRRHMLAFGVIRTAARTVPATPILLALGPLRLPIGISADAIEGGHHRLGRAGVQHALAAFLVGIIRAVLPAVAQPPGEDASAVVATEFDDVGRSLLQCRLRGAQVRPVGIRVVLARGAYGAELRRGQLYRGAEVVQGASLAHQR